MLFNPSLLQYLTSLVPEKDEFFSKLEAYAKEHQVPIMDEVSVEVLLQLLRLKKPKKVLEIGTAIGYSALRMADAIPDAFIVSIERDKDRFTVASKNIATKGFNDRIKLFEGDAFDLLEETKTYGPYDCIFIDAAKGQYQKFFEMFSEQLTDEGFIITDNVLFRGYVYEDTENKRLQKIAAKIRNYNEWLLQKEQFHTVILPIGDGIAISVRKTY